MSDPHCQPRKRTYTPVSFLHDLAANATSVPGLLTAYAAPGRLEPALREKVMLGVTRVNQCRHCAAIHGLWGSRTGIPRPEIEALVSGDPLALGDGDRATIELACAAATGEGAVSAGEAARQLRERFGPRRGRELVAVARAINLANRLGNTWDAFAGRLRGQADEDSSLLQELVVLGAVAPVGAPFLAVSKTIRMVRGEPEF